MSLPTRCSGKDGPDTFTFKTLTERMPVILTKVIDQLSKSLNELVATRGEEARIGVKDALSQLSKLKRDLVTDKPLEELDDTLPDSQLWKSAVAHMSQLTWHSAPWLYSECYMYRAIYSAIEKSGMICGFDPFQAQKEAAFVSAVPGMESVAAFLSKLSADYEKATDVDVHQAMQHEGLRCLILFSLWGNRVDLCLLSKAASESSDEVSALQAVSSEQLSELDDLILANDMERVLSRLMAVKEEGQQRRLDIVLDNSGFELFTDLCLVHFLLLTKLVDTVHLHCKIMPWFVSDNLCKDVHWTLDQLQASQCSAMVALGTSIRDSIDQQRIVLSDHTFYTLPYEFCKMAKICPGLYTELQKSYLIFFKGDLNYRKLVADRRWPHTTSFKDSLCGFEPSAVCTLRTLKAECVVGLEGKLAEATAEKDSNWLSNGKYAVVQLHIPS